MSQQLSQQLYQQLSQQQLYAWNFVEHQNQHTNSLQIDGPPVSQYPRKFKHLHTQWMDVISNNLYASEKKTSFSAIFHISSLDK